MKSSILKRVCVAAMFFLMLGLANRASATAPTFNGVPWQVGDVIICFGTPSPGTFGGACNVVRIVNNSPVLLDQFSDGLLGDTKGVTLNNTLHAVVTDNGTGHNGSNVVVYTIASVDPTTSPSSPIANPPSPGPTTEAVWRSTVL